MSKKNSIRIGFFIALVLLSFVGYVSLGGLSKSDLKVQTGTEYLVYGKLFKGSAKTQLGQAFKEIDSISLSTKGEVAGFFYTNPTKQNKYQVEVFVGINLDQKLNDSIVGFEYRNFKFAQSIQGSQDAFFLFSTLYNDIFQFAESQNIVLDSVQSFERYPSKDKTIIEIPFK